ncbi:MAG: AraC family transcriptional regulator [Lachnospiraceae bacterium]|nr:AraC family transcriptional regulator [Lachnospiraceae bacterium]
MFYDAELSFFCSVLKNIRLDCHIVSAPDFPLHKIDSGLRELLGMEQDYKKLQDFFTYEIASNRIYKMTGSFLCSYIFLLLPDTQPVSVMIIGPYASQEFTKKTLLQLSEKFSIPPQLFPSCEKYFYNIPLLRDDTMLLSLLHTFGEKIWGGMDRFSIQSFHEDYKESYTTPKLKNIKEQENTQFNMQALELRYASENKLLQAVSQGLAHKAEMLLGNPSASFFEQRVADPLRNAKNYAIILNTLLRKAAENGFVHPLHIDRISSDFARKIELLDSPDRSLRLQKEMIRKYCLMVKNHSMKGYSLLVQKVITQIDSDLTDNLTLNAMAEMLKINPSYLSSLFKKETGTTLTDYVNRKRVEQAILLLNTTSLQIQTIAQYCGIPDVNYFTKIFKKYINKTPKEYRENILNGPLA